MMRVCPVGAWVGQGLDSLAAMCLVISFETSEGKRWRTAA